MTNSPTFRCFIIGETSLSTRCAQVILNAGHELMGIITPNPDVGVWSRQHGVPACEAPGEIAAFLSKTPFDYLFSIVNNAVLSKGVLALPKSAAINFHDGPLPRYAGIHSTSWALINQEASHGVTWHIMVEEIDAGPILQQETVKIEAADTAFSLNIKCYEAAVLAFTSLLAGLRAGNVHPREQDLSERTYYPLYQRPEAAAVLDWTRPATQLEALVRALEFGPTPNPLGRAKALLNGTFAICSESKSFGSGTEVTPGTITALSEDMIRVATGDGELGLSRLLSLEGVALSCEEVARRFALRLGMQLPVLSPERRQQISELVRLLARHEAFWVKRLKDLRIPALPYLATASPGTQSTEGFGHLDLQLSEGVRAFLAANRRDEDAETLLASAFALYLWRLSGSEPFDLEVQTPEVTSQVDGLEELFSMRVPLRVSIDEGVAAVDACLAVQAEFRTLRKRLTYMRDLPARYPALASITRGATQRTLPVGVAWVPTQGVPTSTESLDLCLCFPENARVQLRYRDTAISAADVQSIVGQFTAFLEGIAANPQGRLTQVRLISEAESTHLLVEWNDTVVDYSGDMILHHYIERQVAMTPTAAALRFSGTELSYQDINRRANALASQLRDRGIKVGDLVGLYMERSIEMVVGLLATLKAGAAYVPIDPAYPADRVAFMLEDTRVPVLLTQEHLQSRLPPTESNVLCLDATVGEGGTGVNPDYKLSPDQAAYVIYTSGSTGKPKGVMVSHRAISNRLLWMQQEYGLTECDRVLQKTPYSFDVSVWEFFWPLMTGACLTVARPGGHQDAAYLVELIRSESITTLHFVPSMLQLFVEQPKLEQCTSLKRVICSGEALPYDLAQRFFERCSAELHNLYGPTEAAVDVTYWACRRDDERHLVPIGRPVANTQTYILDKYGNPTPVGVPGELHLGGVQLALGYLNRPELTMERFVPDPFAPSAGGRLYRTGDLCRYLPDGAIDFLGRLDFQVKIRGFRIELGEIETALLAFSGIREAAVLARVDEQDSTRTYLAAYVTSDQQPPPTPAQLREHLGKTLPEFMVPTAFVFLERFPLSPNGKLDRKALPVPSRAPNRSGAEPQLPASEAERQLAAIFRDVLKLEDVGTAENFFDMGGDSLRAARIVDRIRETLNPELELVRLFDHPTIQSLAAYLTGGAQEQSLTDAQARAARQRQAVLQRRRPSSNNRP